MRRDGCDKDSERNEKRKLEKTVKTKPQSRVFAAESVFFVFFIKAECHNAVSLLLGATSFHKPKNTVTSQSLCRCKHNAMSPSLRHAPPLNLEHNGDVLPQRGLRGETVEKWTDGYSE